ncbi:family 43 glycosylhydrolase [Chitinispirillales bacterium ANBcel5]|uniref:family 43 glycosylhydrolase n=1 Tax=Cellulosispirillum alkaliphilum TaxID=3039283 RepID=UPI002A528D14|nr:family 43 glycosylhydrolase [Chitinispirillales bacterium ANBcel5]
MTRVKTILSAAVISAGFMIGITVVPLSANPILSHKYTADPQPIVWNNRLYVYASNDDQSVDPDAGYVIQAYTLVSTDDMANWVDHGEVFRVPRDWNRGTETSARAYAPGAAVRDNTVYLYPCGAGGPVGVVTAPRPEGPFNDVHNGTALADRGDWCVNCNVDWLFDPAAFVDDDGQGYLYYGGAPGGDKDPFRVMLLNDDMISLKDSIAHTIESPRAFEAAYMHKRGDIYYFTYVNDFDPPPGEPGAAIVYMTGDNPIGPFTFRGPVLRNPAINGQNINRHNNNHHGIIEYQGNWYMFYHDRRVADANNAPSVNQRNISVDSLVYNEDGTMREVIVTHDGVRQIKNFDPYKVIPATTINRQSGITTDSIIDEGMIVRSISDSDWIRLKGVDFGAGAEGVTVRAASGSSGGSIEFRTGSASGTLIGTCNITSTGDWDTWQDFECDIEKAVSTGVQDFLYLVFRGAGEPFRLSWYQFYEEMVVCDDPPDATPNNLVADGIFSGLGLGPNWTLANVSDGAEASAAVRCNKAQINITSVGTESYQPQLIQQGIMLEQGRTYRLTFNASAAENGSIVVQLERLGGEGIDWGHLYSEAGSFDLTSNEGTYTLDFEMTDPTDENVQLAFNFGGSGSGVTQNVTISDVVLLPTGTTSVLAKQASRAISPSVSVRGRMLNVSSFDSNMSIRVIDLRGKTVARFSTADSGIYSLMGIPDGLYFVELRGGGVRQTTPVVVK